MKTFRLLMLMFISLCLNVNAQIENNLSTEEKLFGLSKLWMEASYNFAFFDQVSDLDWDSCYQAFIPQVMATKTDWDYYLILQKFYALLKDGHTRIFPPVEFRNKYYGTATKQIKTRLIEGKVIIIDVLNDTLKSEGLRNGMELLEIDNYDVHEYADKFVTPYVFASTLHDLALQVYGHFLLSGSVSEPIQIKVKDFNGNTKMYSIFREPWIMEEEMYKGKPLFFNTLPNNIGYLKINNFMDTEYFRPKFDSIYIKILETDGLIIDVRDNFGGATQITHYVLKHFAENKFQTVNWKSPMNVGAHKAWGQNKDWFEKKGYEIHPFDDRPIYKKPVNVIVDESTFSGAEDFCIGFLTMKRGKLIGRKTAGSTGSPIMFNLPGGALVLVCTKKDFFPDGKEFIGFGISPDIEVETSVKDIIENKDPALDIAIKNLSNK